MVGSCTLLNCDFCRSFHEGVDIDGFIMAMVMMRKEIRSRRTRSHFPDNFVGMFLIKSTQGGQDWWCDVVEGGGRREGNNDDDDSRTKMNVVGRPQELFCIHS